VLRVAPDLARAEALISERGGSLGSPFHLLATTTSTNDEAKSGARAGAPHGATWVAEEQSAGRGRQGRTWTAARGESLLFSVLLRLDCPPPRVPLISILAGLVVRDAVARAAPGATVGVKWPNDVVGWRAGSASEDSPRKVAGILVEAITSGRRVEAVIVGVGINVHSRDFPADIASRATSVALLGRDGREMDRASLLADVLSGLDRDLHIVLQRGLGLVRARLDAADVLRGKVVRNAVQLQEGVAQRDAQNGGVAMGIDDDGRLLVRIAQGEIVRFVAGEVHLGME
jgi:BirA family biotin operon repressor/biotin-[acetyl-CoA-carboxylase] ligase